MANLKVQIARFVDKHFPGFVECVLIDVNGVRHEFFEKGPMVSTSDLTANSLYPQSGYIGCIIEEEWRDKLGRRLIRVSTTKPWSIESIAGSTSFTVFENQISLN